MIDYYKDFRPLLTRKQIKDAIGYLEDQGQEVTDQTFCKAADYMFPPDSIGMHVKKLRTDRKLSGQSLAYLSAGLLDGISRSSIHNIETGQSMVNAAKLFNALCVGLEITPNELLSVYGYNWPHDC